MMTTVPSAHVSRGGTALLERWRRLPAVDAEALRRDVESVIDPSL